MGEYLVNPEEILALDDFTFADVQVPEWGGKVRVRSLSGAQRGVVQNLVKKNATEGIEELLVVMAVVDPESGKRVFTKAHLEALKAKSSAPVTLIAKKVMEISGITEAKTEDAEKNLEKTQSEDSLID